MNMKNIKKDELFTSLTTNTTVITANHRLANNLREQFDSLQMVSGKHAWPSPDILPLNAWIERCWQQCGDSRVVTNSFQEQLIWEGIIRDSNWGNTLLQISATAKSANQAWQLLQQWNLSLDVLQNYNHTDSQAFVDWAQQFLKLCKQQGWIDQSSLPHSLHSVLESNKLSLPDRIIFCGFEQLYPQIKKLIFYLNHNVTIEFLSYSETLNTSNKYQANDLPDEIITMARWAKKQVLIEKDATIGCIIPTLSQDREIIERIFSYIFDKNEIFNISLGKTLTLYPLVKAAFQALHLSGNNIDLPLLSSLLSSPFFAGAEQELSARALLDRQLHERGELQISLREVLALASAAETDYHCPIWAARIRSLSLLQGSIPKKSSITTTWINYFNQALQILGWPGERSLNSDEYQTWKRWQAMLVEYASLELLNLHVSCQEALTCLEKLANSIVFQPKTSTAPVQILGVLEASGLEFDYLWVAGLHDETWPAPLAPNPFLPIQLQRELGMPHASVKHEWDYHENLLRTFMKSAKHVIFSYPQYDGDRTLRPSTLLKDIPTLTSDELALRPLQSPSEQLFLHRQIETYQEEYGPALQSNEHFGGGSSILKYQAACPFKAFTKLRLAAEAIPEVQPGLSASERGMLVHDVLALLWSKLADQKQLIDYEQIQLEQLVASAVQTTLGKFATQRPHLIKTNFIAVEQQRLQHMLLSWLQLEKTRSPFKVIATEISQTIKLAELEMHLRIDRIDQLDQLDGDSYLILDYKTGKHASFYDWLGARPAEPQLPLYSLVMDKPLGGLAFAQIKPNEVRFKGITAQPNQLPNVPALNAIADSEMPQDWNELVQHWRTILTALAENFRAGHAAVDPKDGAQTCQFCDLQILCRVHEVAHAH
jgi:ATP-dependent helicase/nuclease subunit B